MSIDSRIQRSTKSEHSRNNVPLHITQLTDLLSLIKRTIKQIRSSLHRINVPDNSTPLNIDCYELRKSNG